jgi:hypothetical protein
MSVDPGAGPAMPAGSTGVPAGPSERPVDLRLASAHVAGGLYALARAELERLAIDGALDRDALVDLAVARWRTGDAPGAGQAAEAHLAAGGQEAVALVIAAEAAMADGRAADARRLAQAVMARSAELDGVFAGMPQSRVWRAAAGEGIEPDEPDAASASAVEVVAAPDRSPPAFARTEAPPPEPPGADALDAHQLMALAAGALRSDPGRAAVELALVLRSEPSLAPAVVELLARQAQAPASRPAAALEIVRGDAYRLIGRRREAEVAYGRARSMLEQLEGVGG